VRSEPKYPRTFSPIRLGPVEVQNRFYFAPHGVALSVGTRPSDDFVAYSVARVQGGGCGLVVHSLTVHPRGTVNRSTPHPADNVPAFGAMADAIHAAGGKVFAEIWYQWIGAGFWQPLSPSAPPLGPSAVPYEFEGVSRSTHEMGKKEIAAMVAAFSQSTAHLRQAGYDGVMLHAAHGALLEQFLSPYFNRRTDEYGGRLTNRMRFPVECLEAARAAAGDHFAVGMRLNTNELLPGGYATEETRQMLTMLSSSGLIDFVDLDIAVEPQQLHLGMPPVFVDRQVYRPYVEAVRDAAGDVPVLSVLGRLTTIAEAEAALEAGVCDMAGAARALIAEPDLVRNAREGNEVRSRTCIACNWCMESRIHGAAGCAINPASYRERTWGVDTLTRAERPSKVVVVGGGPAGLEAARVSALRGHEVILFEARPNLGGALALWASLPGREWVANGVEWWQRELDRLGVATRLGLAGGALSILAEGPDAVIVATGALYSQTGRSAFLDAGIPGHDRRHVYRPEQILLEGIRPSGKVVLLDAEGLHTSSGVAELLALAGAEVHYVTPGFAPASARLAASHEFPFVVTRLKEAGVTLLPSSYLRRIDEHDVVVYDVFTGEERVLEQVDAVVLSTCRLPLDDLGRQLEGRVEQLFTVGDALSARSLAAAVYEGHKFARYLGEPLAPKSIAEAYFMADPPEVTPLPAGERNS
jgi:2,4-dienoyl-CoA reductase-like NADH-dependent reductase (Old Yellow Enzyme family)